MSSSAPLPVYIGGMRWVDDGEAGEEVPAADIWNRRADALRRLLRRENLSRQVGRPQPVPGEGADDPATYRLVDATLEGVVVQLVDAAGDPAGYSVALYRVSEFTYYGPPTVGHSEPTFPDGVFAPPAP